MEKSKFYSMSLASVLVYDEDNDQLKKVVDYVWVDPFSGNVDFYISKHDHKTIFINQYKEDDVKLKLKYKEEVDIHY